MIIPYYSDYNCDRIPVVQSDYYTVDKGMHVVGSVHLSRNATLLVYTILKGKPAIYPSAHLISYLVFGILVTGPSIID